MINRALKLIRQFHDLKQFELADQLGISKSYLSEIESGKKPVNFELLENYSEIFDVSVSSLVFFSESIDKKNKLSEKYRSVISGKILDLMEWCLERKNETTKAA